MKPLRVIVTGGATNIGRAITEVFLAQGARVAIGYRKAGAADPLLQLYGDRIVALPLELGDVAKCQAFIQQAAEALGGVDVLVNNAAITGPAAISSLETVQPAHVDEILRVNITGLIFCCQAALPHLRASGRGVIIHISSINAFRPQRGALVYAATKAAMTSLTQSMAKELAVDHIRVVAVAPGDIQTHTSDQVDAALTSRGVVSDVVNQTPLGRGRPADVAETVAFLCSDKAAFVTGVTWLVDGGLLA